MNERENFLMKAGARVRGLYFELLISGVGAPHNEKKDVSPGGEGI